MANLVADFASLLSEIVSIQLFYRRLNDVEKIDGEVFNLIFKEVDGLDGKKTTKLYMRSNKHDDYNLTIRQLAGLRISTGKITAKWFEEFKEDQYGDILQNVAPSLAAQGRTLEDLRFKVSAQLIVKNEQITTGIVPVYQDKFYEGANTYKTEVRNFTKGKPSNFWETYEYSSKVRELREQLHRSPVKAGKDIPANEVRLPIFEVI